MERGCESLGGIRWASARGGSLQGGCHIRVRRVLARRECLASGCAGKLRKASTEGQPAPGIRAHE